MEIDYGAGLLVIVGAGASHDSLLGSQASRFGEFVLPLTKDLARATTEVTISMPSMHLRNHLHGTSGDPSQQSTAWPRPGTWLEECSIRVAAPVSTHFGGLTRPRSGGVDLSAKAIELAITKATERGVKARFLVADALRLVDLGEREASSSSMCQSGCQRHRRVGVRGLGSARNRQRLSRGAGSRESRVQDRRDCLVHAEGSEDPVCGKRGDRHTGAPLEVLLEQNEAFAGVAPALARWA